MGFSYIPIQFSSFVTRTQMKSVYLQTIYLVETKTLKVYLDRYPIITSFVFYTLILLVTINVLLHCLQANNTELFPVCGGMHRVLSSQMSSKSKTFVRTLILEIIFVVPSIRLHGSLGQTI